MAPPHTSGRCLPLIALESAPHSDARAAQVLFGAPIETSPAMGWSHSTVRVLLFRPASARVASATGPSRVFSTACLWPRSVRPILATKGKPSYLRSSSPQFIVVPAPFPQRSFSGDLIVGCRFDESSRLRGRLLVRQHDFIDPI